MPSGRLTTHVLDTTLGRPAAGMGIMLFRHDPAGFDEIISVVTNDDGRCDGPLLSGASMSPGTYELHFDVAGYYGREEVAGAGTFLDVVPIRFVIADPEAHYHVPLLVSPFGYSTYRGS